MRRITVKYAGECARCGADLQEGSDAMYEKSMGIFCPGCEPTEVEEIREFRLKKNERKAERYDDWAAKRIQKANADLNSNPEMRHDWAFITQPGHISERTRMNRRDEKAFESLEKADEMRSKAASLRDVRVAGDAERAREVRREAVLPLLEKGMEVYSVLYGRWGRITRINEKTVTLDFGDFKGKEGIEWISPKNLRKSEEGGAG